jgi:hypothetical protein
MINLKEFKAYTITFSEYKKLPKEEVIKLKEDYVILAIRELITNPYDGRFLLIPIPKGL